MSTLTKVFLVVTLLLSATYLTFSLAYFSQSRNWMLISEKWYRAHQAEVTAHQTDVVRLSEQVASRDREIATLKDEVARVQGNLNATQLQLSQEQFEHEQTKREKRQIEGVHAQVVSDIQRVRQQNQQLQTERDSAVQSKVEAEERAALALSSYHEVESVNTSLQAVNHEITLRLADVQNRYEEARLILNDLKERGFPVGTETVAVPTIRGKVEEVNLDHGIVIINVGADEMVQTGYEFRVYRGEEFLGKVRVTSVFDDGAACDVIEPATGAAIQRGDDVTTHWRY
ncbi:MAG: hypothetical protein HY608_08460 [Planctomycetes bacterium]|nr:hypothetical protein [Planctomycetota bacterium]